MFFIIMITCLLILSVLVLLPSECVWRQPPDVSTPRYISFREWVVPSVIKYTVVAEVRMCIWACVSLYLCTCARSCVRVCVRISKLYIFVAKLNNNHNFIFKIKIKIDKMCYIFKIGVRHVTFSENDPYIGSIYYLMESWIWTMFTLFWSYVFL